MDIKTEQRRRFIINTIYIALILLIAFAIFKYAIPLLLPFLIGFIIASIVQPVIRFFSGKLHFNNRLSSLLFVTLLFALIVFAVYHLGAALASEGRKLYEMLPAIAEELPDKLAQLQAQFYHLAGKLHPDLAQVIDNSLGALTDTLLSFLGNFSVKALSAATSFAGKLPQYFIFLAASIISGYLISANYRVIVCFLTKQIPERRRDIVMQVWNHMGLTVFQMLKAYALLMTITFIELSIGLLIIGVDYALLLALVIAIIDILPILGVGTVLIPWSLISFVSGDFRMGISLLALYLVILAVRQYLEPKVVGVQIGLHPLVTLICIFIGFRLAGLIGMFLLPVCLIILKKLNDCGEIHLWKPLTPEEFAEASGQRPRKKGSGSPSGDVPK